MRRLVVAVLALFLLPLPGAEAASGVPSPEVTGPIGDAGTWRHALWESWFDLGDAGYEEAEYFISGTARRHGAAAETAPYTTRIIVARPAKKAKFNGTVFLDWVNVTAQFENAVDTISAHEMLLRKGFAFVHVSAQRAGICCTPLTPKVWDPVRYAALDHPGDNFAFDIFSQVAQAIRAPKGLDPMEGLRVKRVIAGGQSQSAHRLDTYVREVQPDHDVIDGFLIHGGGDKIYDPPPAVPVLHLLSDFEASPEAPNTKKNYRLWEIAGTAHSDFWTGYHQIFGQGPYTLGHVGKEPKSADDEMHEVAGNYGEIVHPLHAVCTAAGASFPMRYAVNAAIDHLNRWVGGGRAPKPGPRYAFDGEMLARDEHGNALGGIRLPPIDVPVATYVSTSCGLGGHTVPFTDPQLLLLYPTHADYMTKMRTATAKSVSQGFLLRHDATDLLERACEARVRWEPAQPGTCSIG